MKKPKRLYIELKVAETDRDKVSVDDESYGILVLKPRKSLLDVDLLIDKVMDIHTMLYKQDLKREEHMQGLLDILLVHHGIDAEWLAWHVVYPDLD